MDVKTAYLNGVLKEEIYMRIPDGIQAKENQVCKLNKSLYFGWSLPNRTPCSVTS